jgi:hypothetical protein
MMDMYPLTDEDMKRHYDRCVFWLNKATAEAWENIAKEMKEKRSGNSFFLWKGKEVGDLSYAELIDAEFYLLAHPVCGKESFLDVIRNRIRVIKTAIDNAGSFPAPDKSLFCSHCGSRLGNR